MSLFKAKFSQVVAYEALLDEKEVKQYAEENNISFNEAVDILGREYLVKYGLYCITYLEGVSTSIKIVE